jgi:sec-independent protein translocase protein TatA
MGLAFHGSKADPSASLSGRAAPFLPESRMGRIGFQELLVIALIVMVLFGGSRIPQLMRGLGQGIREFRKELKGESDEEKPKDGK